MHWRHLLLVTLLISYPVVAGVVSPSGPDVTGVVMDPAGRPISGAQVELAPTATSHQTGVRILTGADEPAPAARARSDAKGRFALRAPAPGLYRLVVRAPGKVAAERAPLIVCEDSELDPVELADDVGSTIRITDETGRGLAGVWVVAASAGAEQPGVWRTATRRERTGADGVARLARREGQSLSVSIFAPGFAEISKEAVQTALAVALGPAQRGRKARVRTVEPAGKPVSGALVRVGSRAWPVARTDADGWAEVQVPAGEPTSLWLSTADGPSEARNLAPETADLTITLAARPVVLAGRVRDAESGAPLGGALVWSPVETGRVVRTGPDGAYALPAPGGQSFPVRMAAAGHLGGSVRAGDPEIRARKLPAVALRPVVPLSGIVLGPAEAPLGDVLVEAFGGAGAADRQRSAADGRFALRRLAGATTYEIRATRPGFLAVRLDVATPAQVRPLPLLRVVLLPSRPAAGRVVDGRNRPLAGARVVLCRAADPGRRSQRPLRVPPAGERGVIEATTDAQGKFVVAEIPASEIDLFASLSGFTPVWQRNRQLPAGKGVWDLGTVVLQPGVTLAGRVVDPAGKPVAEARIFRAVEVTHPEVLELQLRDEEPDTKSGPDGGFQLADLPAGKPVHLFVTAADRLPEAVRGIRLPTEKPVVVRLEPGGRLAGRVLDDKGDPVADAEVSLAWRPMLEDLPVGGALYRKASTNREGRFEIRSSPLGSVALGVRARGFIPRPPAPVTVPPPQGQELEIRLERGAVLAGSVKTTEGEPVAGLRVAIGDAAGKSDADGAYRVDGLRPGPVEVDLFHPSYRRQKKMITIEPGDNVLDVELETGRRITGRVVDEHGKPVGTALVVLETPTRTDFRSFRTRSALDGSFEIASVTEGKYQITAEAEGFAPMPGRDLVVTPQQEVKPLELVLGRSGTVTGRILGLDPEQLAQVELRADDDDNDLTRPGRVDARGRFEIRDLSPGLPWKLQAELASEQRKVTSRVIVAAGETVERDLEFGNRLTLSGRVEYDGEPLPDARVSVRASKLALEQTAATDYDGGFRIEELEPDTYWVGVRHAAKMLTHNDTLDLTGDREIVIRLEAGALDGKIVDATTREPIEAAIVQLHPVAGTDFVVTGGTDESGRFHLPRVPPAQFHLRVTADGYAPREQTVEVPAGPAGPDIEVALERAPGLELRVRLASGANPGLVTVRAETPAGALVVAEQRRADAEGRVLLTTLPAGTWQLVLGASGGGLVRLVATVPGPPVDVALPGAAPLVVDVPAIAESALIGFVALYDPAGKPLEVLSPSGQIDNRATVVGGRAMIAAVPAGIWRVQVETPDGRQWSTTATTDGQRPAAVEMQ